MNLAILIWKSRDPAARPLLFRLGPDESEALAVQKARALVTSGGSAVTEVVDLDPCGHPIHVVWDSRVESGERADRSDMKRPPLRPERGGTYRPPAASPRWPRRRAG